MPNHISKLKPSPSYTRLPHVLIVKSYATKVPDMQTDMQNKKTSRIFDWLWADEQAPLGVLDSACLFTIAILANNLSRHSPPHLASQLI